MNHDSFARRIINKNDVEKIRKTFRKLSRENVARYNQLFETVDWNDKNLIWKMLIYEINLKCSIKTLQREMHQLDWWKCIACRKSWTSFNHVIRRVDWIEKALFLRSKSKNWNNVRYSDEMHTNFDSQERVYVIRKSNTRICVNCIQHVVEKFKKERNLKKKHVWIVVNYNFKLNMMFYDVFDNINDKMTLQMYRNQILKLVIKSWILEIRANEISFTLKKDDDSNHETSKNNICRTWKKKNLLNCYFNVAESSDLIFIKNCWQKSKQ